MAPLAAKARLAAPITDAQVRLALSFLREMEPDMQELNAFQMRYNAFSSPRMACTGCTDIKIYDDDYFESSLSLYLTRKHDVPR